MALLGDEVIGPWMLLHLELKTDTKFQLQASENKTNFSPISVYGYSEFEDCYSVLIS